MFKYLATGFLVFLRSPTPASADVTGSPLDTVIGADQALEDWGVSPAPTILVSINPSDSPAFTEGGLVFVNLWDILAKTVKHNNYDYDWAWGNPYSAMICAVLAYHEHVHIACCHNEGSSAFDFCQELATDCATASKACEEATSLKEKIQNPPEGTTPEELDKWKEQLDALCDMIDAIDDKVDGPPGAPTDQAEACANAQHADPPSASGGGDNCDPPTGNDNNQDGVADSWATLNQAGYTAAYTMNPLDPAWVYNHVFQTD